MTMHWLESWFLPETCVLSGKPSDKMDLAADIMQGFKQPQAVCPQCCEPSVNNKICGPCLLNPPAFERTRVAYYFAAEVVDLVHQLKYEQQLANARLIAELMLQTDTFQTTDLTEVDALLAVPLHPKRWRQRGYNQAHLIAANLAKRLQIPLLSQAVSRQHNTPSQTGLNATQRRQNLRHAFSCDAEVLKGYNKIALIDDVITTGATMQALASEIKNKSHIKQVEAWAFAKTKA